jgi:hypothetical protein
LVILILTLNLRVIIILPDRQMCPNISYGLDMPLKSDIPKASLVL